VTIARSRILIVDDEEGIRFLWRNALRKPAGAYEVVLVCDGREALEEISRVPFDLVITDLWMPRMNGIELTEAIQQLGYKVPIIWFTARGMQATQEHAERLGVHCCLYKPLAVAEMRQVVADALATSQERANT
jgi:CheY-like chemotaxis protein